MHIVRIWDLPTRLFHWALVVCVVGLVVSANMGGNAMTWHFRFGYCVLTLLLFRLVWGLMGGRWSRFSSFLYAPATFLGYVRGRSSPELNAGHSPTGALSVFAILAVLLAQVSSGLFADDDIAFSGPLTSLASGDLVALATGYHTDVGKFLLIALVILHLLAIAYYKTFKKTNLVTPMVNGDKLLPTPVAPSHDTWRTRLAALCVLALCVAAVNRLIALGASSGL